MKFKNLFWLSMIMLLLSSCTQPSRGLRIGIIKPSIDHFPLSYALEKGWMDKERYHTIPFSTGWEVQEALIVGKIDVAVIPFTYVWNAASKGFPVKIISFYERETDAILAQPEIIDKHGLDGQKIGLLKSSSLDVLWQDYAAREKINYQAIYFRSPNEAVSALMEREIAAAVLYVPIIDKLAANFHVIHWFGDSYPWHPCCDLAVNTKRISGKNKQLVQQLSKDLEQVLGRLDMNDKGVRDFLMVTYGLDESELNGTMQHTKFRMGFDEEAKEFERGMAKISLATGCLDKIPADEDVYLNINDR